MDWSKGFLASYHASVVDPVTWRDIERFEITGGSIAKSNSELIESADLQCVNYKSDTERWVRVWLTAQQEGASGQFPLFTGLACSPSTDIDGTFFKNKVECYSVLKPAADILLPRGWYAPQGFSGARVVKNLLKVIPAPVYEGEHAPNLSQAIIAEDGETNMSMVVKVLKAINWRLRIEGNGAVHVVPKSTEAVRTFDAIENDSVQPELTVENDWYKCPNVFRAVADDVSGVARDDSVNSMLSTVNRGREVWMEETSCHMNDNETVAEYALRRLKEEQMVSVSVSYERRFDPEITIGDAVRLHYPAQGIEGLFVVDTQTIELSYGAKTSEGATKWQP